MKIWCEKNANQISFSVFVCVVCMHFLRSVLESFYQCIAIVFTALSECSSFDLDDLYWHVDLNLYDQITSESTKHTRNLSLSPVCQETSKFAWVQEFSFECNTLINVLIQCQTISCVRKIERECVIYDALSHELYMHPWGPHEIPTSVMCCDAMQCNAKQVNGNMQSNKLYMHNEMHLNAMNKYVKMWFLPCITREFNHSQLVSLAYFQSSIRKTARNSVNKNCTIL